MNGDLEKHPLEPFLPSNSQLLLLGSFPPSKKRWCMDFYYPNPQNDMWRLFGFIFFYDRNHFLHSNTNVFDQKKIESFLKEKGIALYDTASEVIRKKGNASDQFLEVVSPTDIISLLAKIPSCRVIGTTGEKATTTFCMQMNIPKPNMGELTTFEKGKNKYTLFRLPSSSRAYPKPLEEKALYYRKMFAILSL